MYRPNNPRLNVPPMASRDQLYAPKPKQMFHMYDPYEPVHSDSEDQPAAPPKESTITVTQSRGRWDIDNSQKQRENPEPALFPILQTDSTERATFSSGVLKDEHKDTDYRPEGPTAVRLSPPPPLQSYKQPPGFSGPEQVPAPRSEVKADPDKNKLVPLKSLVSCDLCEVELSNGQELEEHLDSKTHWDTLEYIQKHNAYDDMAIAFLQDVMLYKSRKSSRAIEDTALQALQEYDHMTKVEMFHCAACGAFVPTSAAAVQSHITTQEHMANTKEFEARQKRLCLDKSATMMKELAPQFMSFAQGASPFE